MAETISRVTTNEAKEFIAFHIGAQTFCIDIMAVREKFAAGRPRRRCHIRRASFAAS